MRRACVLVACAVAVAGVALSAACTRPAGRPTTRILFIGNSYTAINGGIDAQLMRIAPQVEASSVVFGGFTLQRHWEDGHALAAIRQGGWDAVVLQEQSVSAVLAEPSFVQYGRAFSGEISRAGARTVLLMTWERPDAVTSGVTAASLADAYNGLGRVIGADVAPAGTAFASSLRQRPDIVLNASDGHPTPYGTYLAACVVYGTVFRRTPVGNLDPDPAIPEPIQLYLQGVAARALGY